MKSLIGMVPVWSGSIMLDGTDLAPLKSYARVSPLRVAGADDLFDHDRAREHRDRPVRPFGQAGST
jgi:hypothetical protein